MLFNEKAYYIKHLIYDKGIFDKSTDATYIMTMEYSHDRHKNIQKQLESVIPTKNVFILYNKGYKKYDKCIFNVKINKTYLDITYTNLYIFSLSKNLNRILVLEDDFMFTKNIKDIAIQNEIEQFIINKNVNIYALGCLSPLINPFTLLNEHVKCLMKSGAHAMVYSKKARDQTIDIVKYKFKHNDLKNGLESVSNIIGVYTYHESLCNQVHEETLNKKEWSNCFLDFILLNLFRLDDKTNIHKNTIFINKIFKTIHIIVIVIVYYSIFIMLYLFF